MRVLIADGSIIVTQRLTTLISEIPNVEFLAPTISAEATLESVRANDPAVLVMDGQIMHGKMRELLRIVRQEKPAIVMIILSNLLSPQYRKHYVAAGADLVLDKSKEFIHLSQFIRDLARDSQSEEGRARKDGMGRELIHT